MRRFPALLCLLLAAPALQADTYLVLPLFNLSGEPSLNWVGESVAEEFQEALASEGLLVVERDDRHNLFRRLALRPYTALTRASVARLGEVADADSVIFGEFEVTPGPENTLAKSTIRIRCWRLDLKQIRRSPELNELGALEDLASLQSHLVWQGLQHILQPAPTEEEFRRRRRVVRIDAIESYIRGLLAPADQKLRLFTQAARLDPGYPRPAFRLGQLLVGNKEYRAAIEWLTKIPASDPHYREALFLLGLARYRTNDFKGAAESFKTVAADVPLNEVINNYGSALSRLNDPQAGEALEQALTGDEADPAYHFNVGYWLWKQGNYNNAADRFRAVLDRTPDDADATTLLGRCLKQSGPRKGDPRSEGLERLKESYHEGAWRQLKAMLERGDKK
ncbi:MAG: tetratricopeptide repeat protein [Bryobacteraceae bacterium]|nr:tetratricopeptide repeat protein [Bryobacteraceae bacterium]